MYICVGRDGLNRLPIEYTLAKSIAHRRHDMFQSDSTSLVTAASNARNGTGDDGVIVLSEFVSTARVMRGALLINPWKVQEVSQPELQDTSIKMNASCMTLFAWPGR